MIINGLNSIGRALDTYREYFSDRPLDRLIGSSSQPEHINDDNIYPIEIIKGYS